MHLWHWVFAGIAHLWNWHLGNEKFEYWLYGVDRLTLQVKAALIGASLVSSSCLFCEFSLFWSRTNYILECSLNRHGMHPWNLHHMAKMKFSISPVCKSLRFHWLFSTKPVEDRAKCHTYPTFGSILSNFPRTGEIENYIFILCMREFETYKALHDEPRTLSFQFCCPFLCESTFCVKAALEWGQYYVDHNVDFKLIYCK